MSESDFKAMLLAWLKNGREVIRYTAYKFSDGTASRGQVSKHSWLF